MNYSGVENFHPNKDGTFGPKRWNLKQLSEWAISDMKPKRDIKGEIVELILLWGLVVIIACVGVGVLLWVGCHK